MAENTEKAENGDGNGSKVVPLVVLDRFLSITKENNDAYGAMVSAVDAISARVMEMSDAVEGLTGTIEEEQLGKILNTCSTSINEDVSKLKDMMGALTEPKYNILKAIAEAMEYRRSTDVEVQATAKSVIWFLDMVTMLRRHRGKLIFLAGVALVIILGSNGLTAWDAMKVILK